jgi:hypothetical protein
MRLGHNFKILHENNQDQCEWNPTTPWDYWELPSTNQQRFIQNHAEVHNDTLHPLLEAYCLHALLNNDDQDVTIFCHARAHCEIKFRDLLHIIRKRFRKFDKMPISEIHR